jgi:hypothetical protein
MLTKNIAEMLEDTKKHIAMDVVRQGHYWRPTKGGYGDEVLPPSGCFIGCLTHGPVARDVTNKYGIPRQLVQELESVFEALPEDEIQEFFLNVAEAIEVDGKDLTNVIPQYYKAMENRLYELYRISMYGQKHYDASGDSFSDVVNERIHDEVYDNESLGVGSLRADECKADEVQEQAMSILDLMRDAPMPMGEEHGTEI